MSEASADDRAPTNPSQLPLVLAARRFLSRAHAALFELPAGAQTQGLATFQFDLAGPTQMHLPPDATAVQLTLVDAQLQAPLAPPIRFSILEMPEGGGVRRTLCADAAVPHYFAAPHATHVRLVAECVRATPPDAEGFGEECLAWGCISLGHVGRASTAAEPGAVCPMQLVPGGAFGAYDLAVQPRVPEGGTPSGVLPLRLFVLAPQSEGLGRIAPPYMFVPGHTTSPAWAAGAAASRESFRLQLRDLRLYVPVDRQPPGAQWSATVVAHSGMRALCSPSAPIALKHMGSGVLMPVGPDADVSLPALPLHAATTLLVLLAADLDGQRCASAIVALPLCPRPAAVRDAMVRVRDVPFVLGPFTLAEAPSLMAVPARPHFTWYSPTVWRAHFTLCFYDTPRAGPGAATAEPLRISPPATVLPRDQQIHLGAQLEPPGLPPGETLVVAPSVAPSAAAQRLPTQPQAPGQILPSYGAGQAVLTGPPREDQSARVYEMLKALADEVQHVKRIVTRTFESAPTAAPTTEGGEGQPTHEAAWQPEGAVRIAPLPMARAPLVLSAMQRALVLEKQKPLRHPETHHPLTSSATLAAEPWGASRWMLRFNGATLYAASGLLSAPGSSKATFSLRFRVTCAMASTPDGGVSSRPLSEALVAVPVAAGDSNRGLFALYPVDGRGSTQGCFEAGAWTEPLHAAETIALLRSLRDMRLANAAATSMPPCVRIDVYEGASLFPVGQASVPLDAFDRVAHASHVLNDLDVVLRDPRALSADLDGDGPHSVCPAHFPIIGVLHLTAASVGIYTQAAAHAAAGGAEGGNAGTALGPTGGVVVSARAPPRTVEVPRLKTLLDAPPATAPLNTAPQAKAGEAPPAWMGAKGADLHARRVDYLKKTVLAGRPVQPALVNGGADRVTLDFQMKVAERQRDEAKHRKIQEMLRQRVLVQHSIAVVSGRPHRVDTWLRNPYAATMAFRFELPSGAGGLATSAAGDPELGLRGSELVSIELDPTVGSVVVLGPNEQRSVSVYVRARHVAKLRPADEAATVAFRISSEAGELARAVRIRATILPPLVDRHVEWWGAAGSQLRRTIFVRAFSQHALDGGVANGTVALAHLNTAIGNLCSYARVAPRDAGTVVSNIGTRAQCEHLPDGAVAAWESLDVGMRVPQDGDATAVTPVYVHLYADPEGLHCLESWALHAAACPVLEAASIVCDQRNTFLLPLPDAAAAYVSVTKPVTGVLAHAVVPKSGGGIEVSVRPQAPGPIELELHCLPRGAADGQILRSICRVEARLAPPTLTRRIEVAPSAQPIPLRVLVRNDDNRQRAFRVYHNYPQLVTGVAPSVFVLGAGDEQAIAMRLGPLLLPPSGATAAGFNAPVRLTVCDDQDKIVEVYLIDVTVTPAASRVASA